MKTPRTQKNQQLKQENNEYLQMYPQKIDWGVCHF